MTKGRLEDGTEVTHMCDGCRRVVTENEELLCWNCVTRTRIFIQELQREIEDLKKQIAILKKD